MFNIRRANAKKVTPLAFGITKTYCICIRFTNSVYNSAEAPLKHTKMIADWQCTHKRQAGSI